MYPEAGSPELGVGGTGVLTPKCLDRGSGGFGVLVPSTLGLGLGGTFGM